MAPAAATYIMLLLLTIPFVPLIAKRRRRELEQRRARIDEELAPLAAKLGNPPLEPVHYRWGLLRQGLGICAATVGAALLAIAIELLLH